MCGDGPLLLFFLLIVTPPLTVLYGLPTWITLDQQGPHREHIRLVNWLLGWTVIGWIVAFAWAWQDGKKHRY